LNILVSGGAGFIGSHIVEKLVKQGEKVTVIDNLSSGKREYLSPNVRLIEMDIRDKSLQNIWKDELFDVLIHLAAQMDVRKSVEDPCFDADVNLLGLLNLMEIGRNNGLKKVLFASSGGAGYDDSAPFPTPENHPPNPISPYGIAKMATEMYLKYYSAAYNIPYVALRLANVYGPRQNNQGEAGVVAIFCTKLIKGEKPVVNGDGLQTRDYVYVEDVAHAFMKALVKEESDYINIATSEETNVIELFELVASEIGSDNQFISGPGKAGEVRRSCLGIQKAESTLGWEPEHSLLDGIKKTVQYFKRSF